MVVSAVIPPTLSRPRRPGVLPAAKPVVTGGGMGVRWNRAAARADIPSSFHAPDFWMSLTFVNGTRGRPHDQRSRNGRASLLRQAGEAQAGDLEFENFRCRKVSVPAKDLGDGQLGIDGKHATEFGACLVEMAEMSIGGDFDPHC